LLIIKIISRFVKILIINLKTKIMSLKKIVLLVVVGLVALLGIIWVTTSISCNNNEIDLRKEATAQKGKVEAVYDNMWKIIHQTNEVKESYSADFKETCKLVMEGRYSKGDGSLMKWVTEQNPTLSPAMYTKVMDAIMIERDNFTTQQERMLDIIREHDALCEKWPGSWVVTNKTPIEYTVISSTRAKEVMKSGIDDNVEL
jgi:hypothetical protein